MDVRDISPKVDEEEFIYLQECLTSLNSAWNIIVKLESMDTEPSLASASYRFALIEYAKPYKYSRGTKGRKHKLPFPELSSEDKKIHKKILDLRDQVLAHSDLNIKEAKVYKGNIGDHAFPLIISSISPQLPDMNSVKILIERTLDQLYERVQYFESAYNNFSDRLE